MSISSEYCAADRYGKFGRASFTTAILVLSASVLCSACQRLKVKAHHDQESGTHVEVDIPPPHLHPDEE
jgi:hypothetical protein